MTDKELHKLKRHEILQIMVEQGRETEKARQQLAKIEGKLQINELTIEHLKERLDDKDRQIEHLKNRLNIKDAQISQLKENIQKRKITIQESGSIAEAALKLSGIFETAQQAAEEYLSSVRQADRFPEDTIDPAEEYRRLMEALESDDALAADLEREFTEKDEAAREFEKNHPEYFGEAHPDL